MKMGKIGETTEALPRSRYSCGLEIGCSIGVLTLRLGQRCTRRLDWTSPSRRLRHAVRCAQLPGVPFERRMVPSDFPSGEFAWLFPRSLTTGRLRILRGSKPIADHQPPVALNSGPLAALR